MASDSRRFSLSLALFLLSALLVTSTCARTVDGRKKTASDHMIISVESLSPREECTVTSQDAGSRPGLKVVNRHGPCSPNRQNISLAQILNQDRIRVSWIRSKITGKSHQAASPKLLAGAAEIPANTGDSLGFGGEYVVTVGFGTPSLKQTVMFDTGSDVTWIQCQPCVKSCYQQQEQIFDPKKSSTYTTISCTSPYCSSTELSWYNCTTSGDTCVYHVEYSDGYFTQGYYSTDALAITSTDTIQNFRFGCGQYQGSTTNGTNGKLAGFMGLGRAPSSVVLQAKSIYGGVFSYCLPPTSSSTGYLAFGNGSVPSNVQYTPMLSASGGGSSFYFLQLISISVGGSKLAISPTVFSNAGTIIDSGTTITHLPPTAYSELRTAFTAQMTQYKMSSNGVDACYDFTGLSTVKLPSVVLEFEGPVSVYLDPSGILFESCLAFSPNGADADVGIIGNVIQKTFSVVYDVPNLQIGFGLKGC